MTIDDLVARQFIPLPQHIKIDVDGIEHKILEGAKETLLNPLLQSVLVELNTNLASHNQVVDWMKECGFLYTQERAHDNKGPFEGVMNFIFYREPKSEWERCFSYASRIPFMLKERDGR
jgi:hypothetical protein